MGDQVAGMDATQQQDLADALQQASNSLAQANQALSNSLQQAAEALQQGDTQAAQEALDQAAEQMSQIDQQTAQQDQTGSQAPQASQQDQFSQAAQQAEDAAQQVAEAESQQTQVTEQQSSQTEALQFGRADQPGLAAPKKASPARKGSPARAILAIRRVRGRARMAISPGASAPSEQGASGSGAGDSPGGETQAGFAGNGEQIDQGNNPDGQGLTNSQTNGPAQSIGGESGPQVRTSMARAIPTASLCRRASSPTVRTGSRSSIIPRSSVTTPTRPTRRWIGITSR